jgi:hypothetical protein
MNEIINIIMKQESSMWGNPEVVLSAPKSLNIASVSAGSDFSFSMSDFNLKLEPGIGPTSLTQVISFRVPFTIVSKQQLIGYKQTLLFGLQRTPGVRVLMMMDLAGSVKIQEFDFADEIDPEGQVISLKDVSVFSVQGLELGVGLDGQVAEYAATIAVTIQRRNLEGSGLVHIDNLDVRAICCNGNE